MRSFDEIAADIAAAKPMMASTVIAELQKLVAAHGDLPVILADKDIKLAEVIAYDANGNTVGPRVEIGLHGW